MINVNDIIDVLRKCNEFDFPIDEDHELWYAKFYNHMSEISDKTGVNVFYAKKEQKLFISPRDTTEGFIVKCILDFERSPSLITNLIFMTNMGHNVLHYDRYVLAEWPEQKDILNLSEEEVLLLQLAI